MVRRASSHAVQYINNTLQQPFCNKNVTAFDPTKKGRRRRPFVTDRERRAKHFAV